MTNQQQAVLALALLGAAAVGVAVSRRGAPPPPPPMSGPPNSGPPAPTLSPPPTTPLSSVPSPTQALTWQQLAQQWRLSATSFQALAQQLGMIPLITGAWGYPAGHVYHAGDLVGFTADGRPFYT